MKIGGSLHALGGIAAKNNSQAQIKGDLHARYLNSFSRLVKRNAIIEREIINCQWDVEGDLLIPNGELMGGKTYVAGAIHIKLLGSPAGERTVLMLASIQAVEQWVARTEEAFRQTRTQLTATEAELENLKNMPNAPPAIREKLTEPMFEQSNFRETMKALVSRKLTLQKHQEQHCKVDLHVQQVIKPGTVIVCRGLRGFARACYAAHQHQPEFNGRRRIRTFEGLRQQIYSLPLLAT